LGSQALCEDGEDSFYFLTERKDQSQEARASKLTGSPDL
jgi:hypothetical protein